jgi:HAD superfamily hydrolase (TIGR01509 family)
MQRFEALFCDMDGTLLLSEPLHWRAWMEVLAEDGVTLPADLDPASYIGMADAAIAAEARARFGARRSRQALLAAKGAVFMRLCQKAPPPPPAGRDAFLARVRERYTLAIVTSTSRHEAVPMLEGAGILSVFDFVVAADDTAQHKPDPAPYLEAARRAGVRAERALVIEDSAFGLEAAQRAGLAAVGIHTARGVRRTFPALPHFDDFGRLDRWLQHADGARRAATP